MKIIISENQLNGIKNILKPTVLYSAIFINKNDLINKYPPVHENIYYDHSTIKFNPGDISNLSVGENINLKIIGRLTTDKVDALLVDNSLSDNTYPHITLSTAEGIKPFVSNSEIENNQNKIVKLNDNINGVIGYCNKKMEIITENIIIKESPDRVKDRYGSVAACYAGGKFQDISFCFYNGKPLFGLNSKLYMTSKKPSNEAKHNVDKYRDLRFLATHDGIFEFNKLIGNLNLYNPAINRSNQEYPGRFWIEDKIISFWIYPSKEELPKLLKSLNEELYKIYGFFVDFDNYKIEINYDKNSSPRNWDNTDLIPLRDYNGSQNVNAEEMSKMHLMPSDEKKKQPQMQAALSDKYKNITNKLGDMTQAEYNFYKRYGMGEDVVSEDINIPVEIGDTVLMGKFKNKKTVINNIGEDEYGMPTINNKKATTFRISNLDSKINEVKSNEVDLTSFKTKQSLNSKIWKTEDKLNSRVRVKLLEIADDFLESLNIKSKYIKDYLFLGSLANYNWSKYSDIDLHILIDFSKINKDTELVKEYFDSKKKLWNDEHSELKIYGFQVELYVQDIQEENASTGVYSLEKNKWINKPNPNNNEPLDVNKIKSKSADIMTEIDKLNKMYTKKESISDIEDISKKAKKLFDKVKKIRKDGLNTNKGEMSSGNIIFKVLRRSGYLEKLVDLKRNTYDKINTIK